jgi:hypothetical protein
MICKRCGHRYDANLAATYPGGFEAPGTFFYLSLILALVTFLLWIFRIAYLLGQPVMVLVASLRRVARLVQNASTKIVFIRGRFEL